MIETPFAFLKGRATLAPMAGVSDVIFRRFCRERGCAYTVTEMVSAKGYLMAGKRPAVRDLLAVEPGEVTAVQLFGHDPSVMAEAACRLAESSEEGPFHAIDINMGCPAPKITGNGDGSALMRSPALAEEIIRAVRKAINLPLTVKMRLGWSRNTMKPVEFARRIQDAGAELLTVHGRTKQEQYSGKADLDAIGEIVRAVDIPVIGNGDVADAASFQRMLSETGCFAAAIGRASLGNPWIFNEINAFLEKRPFIAPTYEERIALCIQHAEALVTFKGEAAAIAEMRKHAAWYLRGARDASSLRVKVQSATTLEELKAAFYIFME